jgi:uncharacterized beta-barrel protein YwiB (DUF1934 family)
VIEQDGVEEMTKDVLISISGLHYEVFDGTDENRNEQIEVITSGNYYLKGGKHYILFDEMIEGMTGIVKNKIKISDNHSLEILKTGLSNAHLIFEKDQKHLAYYETPFGQMLVGVNTRKMDVSVTENKIGVEVDYELDINHQPLADCQIRLNITPKESSEGLFIS